ncbi:MAG: magnesium transporter [Myxococcaceae bacterium]
MNEDLKSYFASLPYPADITEYLEQVELSEWPKLLRLIEDREKRAQVVAEIDESKWRDLLAQLPAEEIADLISEMESDDAADIIAKLPLSSRYETLYRLPVAERHRVLELLGYPEDSAGGIMQIELARVQADAQVSDAILRVRELVEEDVEVLAVWVVDTQDCLVGSVDLSDLLIHKSTQVIRSFMKTDVICVRPLIDQKEVAQLFRKYDLLTLPVVDDENHLIGRISVDDVVDVLTEEAEEDALRMAGTSTQELIHPEQVFSTARIRLPWLAVALFCSLISASLLKFFQPLLEQMVAIYAFLPVIMAMGGNVGTQSSTILIRGLATGKADLSDIPRMLFKEIRVGLIMGIFYGACAGLVATFILSSQNYILGCVVLISMIVAMITAAALGVLAPALLKKLNVDPAIAAGPFVTTMNDITGILIYILTSQLFYQAFRI